MTPGARIPTLRAPRAESRVPPPARPASRHPRGARTPVPANLLSLLLPAVLLVLQATLAVPQLVRLVRVSDGGVPLTGEALALATGAGWLVWAVLSGDVAMSASALLGLAGFGPTTWVLLRRGRPWRLAATVVASLAVVEAVGLVIGGLSLLATLLTSAAVVQYGAYLTAAARCTDWSGFSPASGALRVVYGLGWTLHGHLTGSGEIVAWGLMTAATFAITLTVATAARRRDRDRVTAPAPAG